MEVMGVLQAMIAHFETESETFKCFNTPSHSFVFLLSNSLYFVAISSSGHNEEAVCYSHTE